MCTSSFLISPSSLFAPPLFARYSHLAHVPMPLYFVSRENFLLLSLSRKLFHKGVLRSS
ncbi:Hypothetical protein, putative [Bodo saltans]|uniref:Uncharacterized protein n=1 Tax=Bodo saltans TaxID=75058 RepID=A0A0S4KJJ5_BODSA|nr:Hypothetical protein, putative [Bodo saltans]|eukprot:CUI14629.1 Hypothetical protein, putative [Bodo saltans]